MKKLKNKSKSPMKITLFVMIFFMIIGFSSLSITRFITGGVNLGFNFDDVNVYIANLYSNSINRFNSISEDKKSFNIELQNGTNNVDIYVSNNSTQYDEYINFVCNESDLNGVSITPNGDNTNIAYSQVILKNTFVIENTGETQTLNCRLENLEVESTTKVIEKKRVIFALDGFENETAFKYVDSMTYGDLPIIELDGYDFLGWYNSNDELVESTTEITNFSDEILYGKIEENTCPYEAGQVWNFDYTGGEQEFTAMCAGSYKMELWGAQGNYGGTDNMPASQAGKGAYTVGTIGLNQNDKLYIYVGENNHSNDYSIENATFNGGGSSISLQNNVGYYGAAGGGATDIRLVNGNWNDNSSLNSRIMVAAGGGSGSSSVKDGSSLSLYSTKGGSGGTLVGENASAIYGRANVSATYLAKGGTQTSGGAIGSYDSRYGIPSVGLFGIGGTSSTPSSANGNYSQGGGGGGWYGGAGGSHYPNIAMSGGAGGSSYISGHAGCVANTSATSSAPKNGCANGTTDIECSKHYSGYIFTDTNMISGNESMPTHDGKSTMIGNYNSGYAKITYLGKNI